MSRASRDSLFGGTMAFSQPARGEGYRVNVDAVLLAWFAGHDRRAKRAVDLGAGVGAVALCLLYRDRVDEVVLVERDEALSALSQENLDANGWTSRGHAVCADVANARAVASASADLVVCNPPYVTPGRGRVPRVAAGARVGDLTTFTTAARRLLAPRGRAAFVYPANELAMLFAALRTAGLEPKRLCLVHAHPEDPARVALVLAVPGKPGGLVVMPPFVERAAGEPSPSLVALLAPVRSRAADRA